MKRIYTVAVTFAVSEDCMDSEGAAEDFVADRIRGSVAGLEIISTDSRDETEEYETSEVA